MTCQEAIDVMGEALDGRLQPAFRPRFQEHMAECGPCATYLEHLRVTRNALRHLPPEGGKNPRREQLIEAFRREFDAD